MPNALPSYRSNKPLLPSYKAQQAEKERGTASERGYDASWRSFREAYLREFPLCVDCIKINLRYIPATEIHHVNKLAQHPHLKFDAANLMPLCKRCHSKRTMNGE